MDNSDYFLELYGARTKRLRRVALLLFSLCCLMLVNFFSHQWQFNDYYKRLPIILYDFCQEYRQPLTSWWDSCTSNQGGPLTTEQSAKPDTIPFHSAHNRLQRVPWDEIPLLGAYLDTHLPKIRRQQTFLGWQMGTPLFLFVSIFAPSVLLFWMLFDVRMLSKVRVFLLERIKAEKYVRLISHSIFFSRTRIKDHEFKRLRATGLAVLFFVIASFSSMLAVLAPLVTRRFLEGTLYLTPIKLPDLSYTPIPMRPPEFFVSLLLALFTANAIVCVYIGKGLARIRSD